MPALLTFRIISASDQYVLGNVSLKALYTASINDQKYSSAKRNFIITRYYSICVIF